MESLLLNSFVVEFYELTKWSVILKKKGMCKNFMCIIIIIKYFLIRVNMLFFFFNLVVLLIIFFLMYMYKYRIELKDNFVLDF